MSDVLDRKDLRILCELERNARQSYNDIGRSVGLSKEVVLYRVRNLEGMEIVRNYITEVDIYRLGFRFYPMLLKFRELSTKEETEIIEYLKHLRQIGWLARCEGTWDLNIVLVAQNTGTVAEFFEEFERRYGDLIIDKTLMHTVSQNYFKRNFGTNREQRKRIITEETEEQTVLTEKEEKLLNILSRDARKQINELSKAIGVSPPTIITMIRKLEQQKIVQGYRIFTDVKLLGYSHYKLWLNLRNMTEKDWKALYTFLGFEPYVLWATRVIGQYDFSIELEVPDAKALHGFVDRLRERFHEKIKRRDTLLLHEEVAISYFPAKT
jgi:DNA-binding Lrp family transcriptional regulator